MSKKIVLSVLIMSIFMILSCTRQMNRNNISEDNISEDFSTFWYEFMNSDKLQHKRTIIPLKVAYIESNYDYDYDRVDTIVNFIKKENYTYINLQQENIIYKFIAHSDSINIVELGISDTGVNILYNFVKRNGVWFLTEILDRSN